MTIYFSFFSSFCFDFLSRYVQAEAFKSDLKLDNSKLKQDVKDKVLLSSLPTITQTGVTGFTDYVHIPQKLGQLTIVIFTVAAIAFCSIEM